MKPNAVAIRNGSLLKLVIMQVENYDNFFLGVEDIEKTRSFYQETLGVDLKFNFRDMAMVAFNVGENQPAIILKDLGWTG